MEPVIGNYPAPSADLRPMKQSFIAKVKENHYVCKLCTSAALNPGIRSPDPFDLACAQAARQFHSSIPEYAPTPLVSLPSLAAKTGVASIHVKDESYRFGLDAFKVLGGSYSIARKLGELLDIPVEDLSMSSSPPGRSTTRPAR